MLTAARKQDEQFLMHSVHVAERMADAIVQRLGRYGQCSIMDIRAIGFSLNDITRYWPDACKIAERKNSKWRNLNGT